MEYHVTPKPLKLYEVECLNCSRYHRFSENENGDREVIVSERVERRFRGDATSVWGRSIRVIGGGLRIDCDCGAVITVRKVNDQK